MKEFLTFATLAGIVFFAYKNRKEYVSSNRRDSPLFEYVCDFRNAGVNYHIIKIPRGVDSEFGKYSQWAYYGVPDDGTPFNPFEPKTTVVLKNCYRCYAKDKWCPDNAWEPLYTISVTNSVYGHAKEVVVVGGEDSMHIYRIGRNGLPRWILY